MDPRLLKYYNAELTYLCELRQQFAEEFPKRFLRAVWLPFLGNERTPLAANWRQKRIHK